MAWCRQATAHYKIHVMRWYEKASFKVARKIINISERASLRLGVEYLQCNGDIFIVRQNGGNILAFVQMEVKMICFVFLLCNTYLNGLGLFFIA